MLKQMAATAALVALIGTTHATRAQDGVAAFYKGKVIRLVVGSAAGSGYDIMARAVARHLGDHIPGKPKIIVQNQPGAASVIMTNALVASAPHDGTVIGAAINGMPTAPLLKPQSAHFDPAKLFWLGSSDRDTQVVYVWHTAPVQSLDALFKKQLIVGATTPGTTQVDFPMVANAVLGTKFKVVSGYEGTAEINKAMEAGEVQGVGATAWASLKAVSPQWVANGDIHVIAQWNPGVEPDLKNVPIILDRAKNKADRLALQLMVSRLQYGRPFFAPPGVPRARAQALRQAFAATMKDPAFLADAKKLHLEIQAMSGREVEKLVKQVASTPKDVVARVRAALAAR